MGALTNIKESFGRIKLRRESKRLSRNVKSFSIEKASSIGIVYDATNRTTDEQVRKFVQYLKEERKEVTSLGFINSKNSSDIVTPNLNYNYFDLRDLSATKVPNSKEVIQFMNQPCSILIDLSLNQVFPIEYVTCTSKAKFKVGAKLGYREEACDLLIDIHQNNTLEYLIIQIRHYLKMIKS